MNNLDLNPNPKSHLFNPNLTNTILPPSSPSQKHKTKSQKSNPSITSTISLSHRFSSDLSQSAIIQQLRRSKSCGDGRSSSADDFDITSKKSSINILYKNSINSTSDDTDSEDNSSQHENFKCSALCLFIPGIHKKKTGIKTERESNKRRKNRVSKVASLERFECGSWSSIVNLEHDESGPLSYFDLPLELIRYTANDVCSPVKASFVFDKDLKGVLKKNSRKSCESNTRHVRFSTSSPTSYPASPALSPCITPRLMKARNEFNALLEATSG